MPACISLTPHSKAQCISPEAEDTRAGMAALDALLELGAVPGALPENFRATGVLTACRQ